MLSSHVAALAWHGALPPLQLPQRHAMARRTPMVPFACLSEDPAEQSDASDAKDLFGGRSGGFSRREQRGSGPGQGLGTAVFLLFALFSVNQWSRSILFYVVDFKPDDVAAPTAEAVRQFMNLDVGFDEAQYGLLASFGFATLFSITSLFAGGIVDRTDPRVLLAATGALWSAATLWQGRAASFADVLTARSVSSVGQAFSNPASYTILSRLYPEEKRATVNGIYASGVYFGGGLAALSIVLDAATGWRELYAGVGVIGLIIALATLVGLPPMPPEQQQPDRGAVAPDDDLVESRPLLAADEAEAESAARSNGARASPVASVGESLDTVRALLANQTVALLLLASTLRFLAGFALGVWVVPFYRAAFSDGIGTEFALIKACVNGIAGSVSATGGGAVADKLGATDGRYRLWVPAVGSMLAIPCWLGTIHAPTLELSLGCLFLE